MTTTWTGTSRSRESDALGPPVTTDQGEPCAVAGDGLVVVDKPSGWSSHDVVGRVRRLAGTRKVGHAGTLDPMATGVLILGINRATRFLTYLVGADKEYTATIRLGQSTVTDDAEGEVTDSLGAGVVGDAALAAAIGELTGSISQVPSSVSAIKVDGRRSYARVRAGEDVALEARPVTIRRFDVLGRRSVIAEGGTAVTDVDVVVACSSGTYIRALARDLGAALGVGAHLTALRRTRVGPFTLDDAATLEEHAASLCVLDVTTAARRCFPVRELTQDEAVAVRFGKFLAPSGPGMRGEPSGVDLGDARERPVAALAPDGRVVALLVDRGGRARPVLVLDPA
jgi:tRNA pseudouridine55 synthase